MQLEGDVEYIEGNGEAYMLDDGTILKDSEGNAVKYPVPAHEAEICYFVQMESPLFDQNTGAKISKPHGVTVINIPMFRSWERSGFMSRRHANMRILHDPIKYIVDLERTENNAKSTKSKRPLSAEGQRDKKTKDQLFNE